VKAPISFLFVMYSNKLYNYFAPPENFSWLRPW